MLNSIQLAGLVVIALLLLSQLLFALKRDRPVLLIVTLMFFVYFIYASGIRLDWYIREWSTNFVVSEHYVTIATWFVVLIVIAAWCGYSVPQGAKAAGASHAVVSYDQLLLLNLLGLGAIALSFYMRGGIVSVWSRTARDAPSAWYGVVTGLSVLGLIYPLFNYYYSEDSTVPRLLISTVILAVYFVSAMLSGVTHEHAPGLAAFMLVWLKRRKLSLRTALLVLVGGFALVSAMRFSRVLGATLYLGGDLSDAYAAYWDPDNVLNAANSFGEFIVFSKIVEVVDTHTDWQLGKSYLLVFESLVPSTLLPGKTEMLRDSDSQGFLASYYGYSGDYWTSGFYGEAYINFGLPGLVVVSYLVGMVIRRAELLLSSGGSMSWLPHWYVGCLLTGALLGAFRTDIEVAFLEFVMRPIGLAIAFGGLMSLLLPYGPVEIVGVAGASARLRPDRANDVATECIAQLPTRPGGD